MIKKKVTWIELRKKKVIKIEKEHLLNYDKFQSNQA
jgi:hypothetical protein